MMLSQFAYAVPPANGELLSGWAHVLARGQDASVEALLGRAVVDLDWRPPHDSLRLLARGSGTPLQALLEVVEEGRRAQPIIDLRLDCSRAKRWQLCLHCARQDHDEIGRTILRARDASAFAVVCPNHACLLSEIAEEFMPRRRPTEGEVARSAFPVPDMVVQFQALMLAKSDCVPASFAVQNAEDIRRIGIELVQLLVSDRGFFWDVSDWVSRERLVRSSACSLAADLGAVKVLGTTMRAHAACAATLLLSAPSAALSESLLAWEVRHHGASSRNLAQTAASPWSRAVSGMTPFQLRMLDQLRVTWPGALNALVAEQLERRVRMHGQLYIERS